jgi:hypothetical protein
MINLPSNILLKTEPIKMRMIHTFLAVCLSMTVSCKSKPDAIKDTTVLPSFPKTIRLTLGNFLKTESNTAVQNLYLTDSTMIVCDMNAVQTGYFFYEYSMLRKNLLHQYIPFGRQAGKSLNAFSSGISNHSLWVHDVSTNKIIVEELSKNTDTLVTGPFRQFEGLPFFNSLKLLDSNHIIASGLEVNNDKVQEYNIRSKQVEKSYGRFLSTPPGIPFSAWREATRGLLYVKPKQDKLVVASLFCYEMQIIDRNTKKDQLFSGTENVVPDFLPTKASGKDVMGATPDTKYGYLSGAVTDQYIYLLYGGKKMLGGPLSFFSKNIFVYDWEGKPVCKIELDREVNCFAISSNGNMLYTFDRTTGYIVSSKIKF